MRNKKKDILFLCQFFFPEYISSAMLPYQTACAYAKKGYKVGALCGFPKEYSECKVNLKEKINGIEIQRLRYLQLKRTNFLGRLINYFSFTGAVLFNIGKFREYKYVVVYSNPPILPIAAILAHVLFKIRIIFVAYDLYPEIAIKSNILREKSIICMVMNWINKHLYKSAYKVVALSNEMKKFIVKNRLIEPDRVCVIPNWDTTEKVEMSEEHKNIFSEEYKGKVVISYLGNMGTCQDIETLLKVIRYFKFDNRIQFLFAGHGNKKEKLQNIVQKEKLKNVKILDFLQGQDFVDALEISSCSIVSLEKGLVGLCVPSKTYSYIEAGVPIIAIMDECDITKDINKYGNGFMVKNGDAKALVENIMTLLDDKEKIQELQRLSNGIIKKIYNKENSLRKYGDILEIGRF